MRNETGPTLDQRRARHAWDAVASIKSLTGDLQKNYRRETKRLPIRILTAGLGHALAFVHAKGKSGARAKLLRHIADWVLDKRDHPDSTADPPGDGALIKAIVKGNGTDLQLHTEETLAYLEWLTRFAEAELEDDDT